MRTFVPTAIAALSLAVFTAVTFQPATAQISTPSVPTCEGEASYQITFNSNWNDDSHQGARPGNAHFSPMLVATHNTAGVMFQLFGQASPGVKLVAETGKTDKLKAELDADFKAGDVRAYRTGRRMEAKDSVAVSLNAAPDRPLLSFISMIAPSPDWVVGLPGLPLCQNGQWLREVTLNLPAIDAGTDSGTSLTAENFATVPQTPIVYLDPAFKPTQTPKSLFGSLSIQKQ